MKKNNGNWSYFYNLSRPSFTLLAAKELLELIFCKGKNSVVFEITEKLNYSSFDPKMHCIEKLQPRLIWTLFIFGDYNSNKRPPASTYNVSTDALPWNKYSIDKFSFNSTRSLTNTSGLVRYYGCCVSFSLFKRTFFYVNNVNMVEVISLAIHGSSNFMLSYLRIWSGNKISLFTSPSFSPFLQL